MSKVHQLLLVQVSAGQRENNMKINKEELLKIIKEEITFVSSQPTLPPFVGVSPINPEADKKIDPDGYEGKMAKVNLFKMEEYSRKLQSIIADNQNLEPWVQEKIAVAASMIESVAHYMEYEVTHNNRTIGE